MHFHAKNPYCWIDQGILEVGRRPYSEHRGRKAQDISDADREQRVKILRRRGSVLQRISKEMLGQVRVEKIVHLAGMLEALEQEIQKCGGVPKSWK